MPTPRPVDLPERSLLAAVRARGDYADCYAVDVDAHVSQAQFVEAFYTTALFKVERAILRVALGSPSTDRDARHLALGEAREFAYWRVAQRDATQLMLTDKSGQTSSWLMAQALEAAPGARTRLHFGSAVYARADPKTGRRSMGAAFHALLGFHRLYSRALLWSAARRAVRLTST
ncbi:MAG: hypothetical protein JNK75_10410 [Betaproteobacteria bacterium]|nr:hypothetical protein [Betaproteobacteria bacterium]